MLDIIVDLGILKLGPLALPLRVYGYGLMLVVGFLLSVWIAHWRARRNGEDPEMLTRCGILALVGGVIGARIAYVIQHWDSQFANASNPLAAMANISSGGLIYYGGVILAVVLVLGYLGIKKLPIRRYLDILAVCMMLGLAFGRAGCLLHGCCYGGMCKADFPISMSFPMYAEPLVKIGGDGNPYSTGTVGPTPAYAHQLKINAVEPDPRLVNASGFLIRPSKLTGDQIVLARASSSLPVFPAQIFGIINALLLASLLAAYHRLRKREGEVFALMLMLYPITRFVLESIRDDNPHDLLSGVLTHNQYTSILTFALGLAMMLVLRKLHPSAGPCSAQRAAALEDSKSTVRSSRRTKR